MSNPFCSLSSFNDSRKTSNKKKRFRGQFEDRKLNKTPFFNLKSIERPLNIFLKIRFLARFSTSVIRR